MSDELIGRRRELDAIVEQLRSEGPSVVVVAGAVGSGRTTMLRHVGAAAVELGYRVIGADDEPVVVEQTSTETNVLRSLQGEAEHVTTEGESDDGAIVRFLKRVVTRYDERRQIVELLAKTAPLTVLVDGYNPNPAFGSWITESLLPGLRTSGDRVAFVVSDTPERVAPLTPSADACVELGPLDADAVRDHLRGAAAGLVPPLDPDELERLVDAAASHPVVAGAIGDVLAATAAEAETVV